MHELIHGNASFLAVWVLTSIAVVALALLVESRLKASAASRFALVFAALMLPVVLPGWRLAVDGWREPAPSPRLQTTVVGWWSTDNRQPPTVTSPAPSPPSGPPAQSSRSSAPRATRTAGARPWIARRR